MINYLREFEIVEPQLLLSAPVSFWTCLCASACMTLHVRMHVSSKYVPSAWISLRLYVPSMFPPRIYHLYMVSPPVWCLLRVVSLPKYVSLLACSFINILPPFICLSVCTPLLLHVPSVCIFFHVYVPPCVPFECLSLRVYVPTWDFVGKCTPQTASWCGRSVR